jgi:hypothetical protein
MLLRVLIIGWVEIGFASRASMLASTTLQSIRGTMETA